MEICAAVGASIAMMAVIAGADVLVERTASAAPPADAAVVISPLPRSYQDWVGPGPLPRSWHEPD